MSINDLDIHPRIIGILKKGHFQSFETILSLSSADIERATGLSAGDVSILKQAVAEAVPKPPVVTALDLLRGSGSAVPIRKLSTGCPIIDKHLKGGILSRGITEISGESASGKTQLCLQLCLTSQLPPEHGGLGGGAVYVCTEDVFPNKRLHQVIQHFTRKWSPPRLQQDLANLGDNIFVEHVAEREGLMLCVHKKIPILLAKGMVKLVVIDSVAALFRCEYGQGETVKRAKHMASFAAQLHKLGQQHNVPIVCVNQVSANLSPNSSRSQVLPALGLSWANHITCRLMLRRTHQKVAVQVQPASGGRRSDDIECAVRMLEVMFAPHLPPGACAFVVDHQGVSGLE
ncbi:DNA repair protein XRCC3-like isoform X1 [Haliotis rufescens]|uniref:DNA repair protein XRCC3-like isoform X1 n=1 Tax=Haliotis rufescens TaxID=6454 RepID=UPI00201F90D8|nr:DNA repair protein XRCC3-like isoform X1 [Haliotis rufescens]